MMVMLPSKALVSAVLVSLVIVTIIPEALADVQKCTGTQDLQHKNGPVQEQTCEASEDVETDEEVSLLQTSVQTSVHDASSKLNMVGSDFKQGLIQRMSAEVNEAADKLHKQYQKFEKAWSIFVNDPSLAGTSASLLEKHATQIEATWRLVDPLLAKLNGKEPEHKKVILRDLKRKAVMLEANFEMMEKDWLEFKTEHKDKITSSSTGKNSQMRIDDILGSIRILLTEIQKYRQDQVQEMESSLAGKDECTEWNGHEVHAYHNVCVKYEWTKDSGATTYKRIRCCDGTFKTGPSFNVCPSRC